MGYLHGLKVSPYRLLIIYKGKEKTEEWRNQIIPWLRDYKCQCHKDKEKLWKHSRLKEANNT